VTVFADTGGSAGPPHLEGFGGHHGCHPPCREDQVPYELLSADTLTGHDAIPVAPGQESRS
jgi:hypothetical protein